MVKCGETLLEGLKGDEVCGNSVGLSMNDGPTQTVGYIWANIWCMLNFDIKLWKYISCAYSCSTIEER